VPDLRQVYLGFDEMPLISIPDSQRAPIPNANFVATVYHRLPKRDRFPIARLQRPLLSFSHLIDAPKEGKA
jgi:hypothetical protein